MEDANNTSSKQPLSEPKEVHQVIVYHRAWPHHKTTINANIYASNLLSAKAADGTELWRSSIEGAAVRRRQIDTNLIWTTNRCDQM